LKGEGKGGGNSGDYFTASGGRSKLEFIVKKSIFQNPLLPYLLVAPQMVVVLVFFFWPAFDSLRLSVFKTSPFGDVQIFVGLENFLDLLTSPEYYRSVYHSFIFSLGVTFSCLAVSLFLAVLANQKIRGLLFYRSALLWTFGVAPPVSGVIWLFVFHPSYGILAFEGLGCAPPGDLCGQLGPSGV
jgi:sn-glycerol 3-phosphate transport system permease protein